MGWGRRWTRRIVIAGLGFGGALGVALVVCRAAVGSVYPIGSGSMEPTLMTGESVFLRYRNSVERRFDIVAFKDEGGGASIKRVVGFSEEEVWIDPSGDILIDGEYLHDAPGRPAPVVIFDSALQPIDEHWYHGGNVFDPWTLMENAPGEPEEQVWRLEGDLVRRGSDQGLLRFRDRITDGRLLPDGRYERGLNVVHDAIVEFDLRVLEAGGYLRVLLNEESDLFEATVFVYEGEEASKVLVRRIRDRRFLEPGSNGFFGSLEVNVPLGEWISVRMANVDNRISLRFGDKEFTADYRANSPRRSPMSPLDEPYSAGERVKLGGSGLLMEVKNVRVLRDFHVVPRGEFGVERTLTIGTDQIFVLGDNSGGSRDSRDRGPIPEANVIGTAKAVVRPISAFRWL